MGRDDHDGAAPRLDPQGRDDHVAGDRVEAGRRFVREEQVRLHDQTASHSDPLLLTAGDLLDQAVRQGVHADPLERALRPGPDLV